MFGAMLVVIIKVCELEFRTFYYVLFYVIMQMKMPFLHLPSYDIFYFLKKKGCNWCWRSSSSMANGCGRLKNWIFEVCHHRNINVECENENFFEKDARLTFFLAQKSFYRISRIKNLFLNFLIFLNSAINWFRKF